MLSKPLHCYLFRSNHLLVSVYIAGLQRVEIALTLRGQAMHECVSKLSHHWFTKWYVACVVPSHYLKSWTSDCLLIISMIKPSRTSCNETFSEIWTFWKCCLQNNSHFNSASIPYLQDWLKINNNSFGVTLHPESFGLYYDYNKHMK